MKGILANLLIKLGLDSKEFDRGVDGAKKKTNKFADGLKKVGGIIAGAFAVEKIISFGKELAKLGGEAQGVRAAFERIGGTRFFEDMRKSTAGTVSELNLMKRAVMASNFQIPVENLASLFEFATKRAQETGQSVDYLVDSIVLGIGRKSPLILDNLGISAVRLRQELKGAGVEMNTVQDIAAAVGRIAASEMEISGKVIETNAIKIQKAGAAWEDFKLKLAESNTVNKVTSFLINGLNNSISGLDATMEAFKTKGVTLIDLIGGLNPEAVLKIVQRQIEEQNKLRQKSIKHIDEESNAYRNNINFQQEESEIKKRNGRTIIELEDATSKLEERLKTYGEFQKEEIQNTLRQIDANKKLIESLTTLAVSREKVDMGGLMSTRTGDASTPGFISALGAGTNVGLGDTSGFQKKQIEAANRMYEEYMANTWAFVDDMKMAAVEFGTNVVDELGFAFGQLASTGEFPADFGKNILSIIGGFISQLGKMLIGLGIASEAFQALLKSAFTNPISAGLAIAAGAALVLLGGAIQGSVKAGPKGAGTSGGGGYSVTSQSYSQTKTSASNNGTNGNIQLSAVLKGDSIFLSNQRNTYKRAVVG